MADHNGRGRLLETFFNDHDLTILNNGEKTRFNAHTGESSAIDVAVCSPTLSLDLKFSVHSDLCSSDHFPFLIHIVNHRAIVLSNPKWRIR